jgi:O-antigen ligase
MKIVKWLSDNILFVLTLVLLAFIPLWPKIPLLDVPHTWVYVRVEDFLVAASVAVFFLQVIRKKASIKTPLTIPIVIFWTVGALATIYGIIFIFPKLVAVFPNVALLNYLRRIEYLSVFFIAYSAMRSKKFVPYIIGVLTITLLLVVIYGFMQRYFGYPAFLTMNEEFAKGIPLKLSALARIPSTFGGHYDLAAYLVMMIALLGSMVFGFKKLWLKAVMFLAAFFGLILLMMTASRVSFAVYLVTIVFLLILQKKKILILPVVILSIFVLSFFDGITERFQSTVSQVDLVVDARTGQAIGVAKSTDDNKIVIDEKQSTGEQLPQGSGYINFPAGESKRGPSQLVYKRSEVRAGTVSAQVTDMQGDFVVKKVLAYDVSFTTRFQGTWPRAFEAFTRNFPLGSGYSSINLASDNNYLRILGEVGLLGFASFLLIFIVFGIYVYRVLPHVDSKVNRSFVLGVVAALFGVGLNAVLIDVFEASKVAFMMWLLVGCALGTLHLYKKQKIDYVGDLKTVLTTLPALFVYLLIAAFTVYWNSLANYFVGDDFTWLRWVADCKKLITNDISACQPVKDTLLQYFTSADGFFYRPGTKLYFFAMYSFFWLNSMAYHIASVAVHYLNSVMVLMLGMKVFRSKLFGFIAAFLFLILSVHGETVFWISSINHLAASFFVLAGLLTFIYWRQTKNIFLLVLSVIAVFVAPLFHELGIVAPLLIIGYDLISNSHIRKDLRYRFIYIVYLLQIPIYLLVRRAANSHWMSGDYSYNLANLPFNIFGNILGYIGLILIGTPFTPLYRSLRENGSEQVWWVIGAIVVFLIVLAALVYVFRRNVKKTIFYPYALGSMIFVVALLPFLGLGNITYRYSYLASVGIVLILTALLFDFYNTFPKKTKSIAIAICLIAVSLFTFYQVTTLEKTGRDWSAAGVVTNQMMKNFNDAFDDVGLENPVFYFVDVPIRNGEAWVFPVGLEDALWFTFQDEFLTIKKAQSLDEAFAQAEGSASARVFIFNKNGSVDEVVKTVE